MIYKVTITYGLKNHGLDLVCYITGSEFTWDATFKFAEARVQLLHDSDMLQDFNTLILRYISFINKHHVYRQNQLNHLVLVGANNLYKHVLRMNIQMNGLQ